MDGSNIGQDLIVVLVIAVAGGMIARWVRLPIFLGYLGAGIAVGPYGFGLISEQDTINAVANIGVILLLFTVGLEFSLRELKNVGRIAVFGGLCQMFITTVVIVVITRFFGFPLVTSIFFGIIIAESSTAVILRLVMERGELDARYGRVAVSMSLVQDMSIVPVIAVMPAVGASNIGVEMILPVLIALGKATGFLAVLLALGYWVLPRAMVRITRTQSRELFLLSVITLCLAAAIGAYYLGLSAAFGAFVAGLLISQSPFARQAFADIVPLRDTFSAIFFVSLGMFFNIGFVTANWETLVQLVPALIAAKIILAMAVIWLFRNSFKTTLLSGLGLLPVGEFSFIMALIGFEAGIFNDYYNSLIIAVALITMLVSPLFLGGGTRFYQWLSQQKIMADLMKYRENGYLPSEKLELSRHAIICGFGDVGRRIAGVLEKHKFSYIVIDLDPAVVSDLRARNIPCIYGDASNPEILKHADLDKARILLCTMPDYVATETTVRNAKKINPKLDIVARVHRDSDAEVLKDIGVTELVLPFFEGSLEMVRHTLHRFGMSSVEIQYILNSLRNELTEKDTGK